VWEGAADASMYASPAVANGVVYAASLSGTVYAFGVGCSTGGGFCPPLWQASTGGPIYSSPAVANGAVYIGSTDGFLHAYDLNTAVISASHRPAVRGLRPNRHLRLRRGSRRHHRNAGRVRRRD
jgi:outer membrane protein assembly factor BamB